jgi:hypothetical protein
MRYRVQFAADRVGAATINPFEVVVPDTIAGAARNSDLSRRVRETVVSALSAAPAPGAVTSDPAALALGTVVLIDTETGRGSVYFGSSPIGDLHVYPIG